MAEAGRTVRVSGLPTDIEDDRLKDKLLIHFLRARNGGGEIDQVTIVKPTPLSALITFEDSAVAQRIVQDCRHFLEIDGKKYELNASEHPESLDPDQVILNLTATVYSSQLPGGITALKNLRKRHQDVQIKPTSAERCYTLCGPYSKVQAALAQLLCHPGGPEFPETKQSGPDASSKAWSLPKSKKLQVSEDQRRKPTKQKEHREEEYVPTEGENLSSNRSPAHGSDCWEAPNHTDRSAPRSPTAFVEESSLIVDADVFQYLQKNCKKEYQQILSRHGVEVVNETSQGLTTLFLHIADAAAAAAAVEEGQDCMRLAKNAISRLYQENESSICRDQLPKIILHPTGGLQRALENLSTKFPKLLLTEDEQNIYFIGSNRDVSEAKHSLLIDHKEARNKKEDVASLLNFPSYNSGSSPVRTDEERGPLTTPHTEGPLDERIDQMLISEEDDLRADGARRYKLAARFKDSGLSGLGSFPFRPNSSASRQTRQGPLPGHDTQSETTEVSGEEVSRAVAQNTGRDILFKSAYMSPPSVFTQIKTSLNTDVMDTRPKNLTSPFASTPSSLPQNPLPSGSGSTLKRASSFSGTPQQKAQLLGQKSQDDSSKSTARVRERSSSFSSRTVRDKQDVHQEEISVSRVMWQYITEAYRTRVEDLTSDLQMKESFSEGSREVAVILRGADSSKVTFCRQRLQTLVDSVSTDFSVQELRMSELGLSSTEDETLQVCCSEVRSRFKKVVIHPMKKSLYVVGPEQLCSQVAATLREVFSREPEQDDYSNFSSPFEAAQSTRRCLDSSYQAMACTQTGKADGNSGSQQWKTTYDRDFGENGLSNGSNCHSELRNEFAFKEKQDGKIIEKNAMNGENDQTLQGTQTHTTGHRPAETQRTSVESKSGLGGQPLSCACGESKMPLVRTKCGVTMCTACLEKMHLSCKVCHEPPQTPQGIHGEMKKSRLNMSLPGQNKAGVIKITYRIPDGIQGEGHPSPGRPFKGNLFEAYLPDSDEARKLLPRLEEAFRQGLTFTVIGKGAEARVSWDCIPHKTSLHGGRTEKGYPDSTYLSRLSSTLTSKGIK